MKAFPYFYRHPTSGLSVTSDGMDLRDYFAAQILPKLMGTQDADICVQSAYKWADLMMKEREKQDE